ncbi:MAG: hypothetical protein HKO90_07965 [Flavobacteriaceae bacterium]|nr:hypothetical protein [Flavobacteriaceae bacterium]
MKRLLLSVLALMVATLLFSLDNPTGVDEEISQDKIELTEDAENVS